MPNSVTTRLQEHQRTELDGSPMTSASRRANDSAGPIEGALPVSSGQVKAQMLRLLDQTAQTLAKAGPAFECHRRELEELAERLGANRFHLAVLGQFKRGKSTLINALVGRRLLPSAVVPLTAVPTFVRWSDHLDLVVEKLDRTRKDRKMFQDDESLQQALAGLVTERENPKNRLGIARVTIGCPAPILREGVVLIDTPGIGSTFRHNTETTHAVLSQCDAALFVTSSDPPITEQEAKFLQLVRRYVRHIVVVLNKIDYLSGPEKKEAVTFLEEVLAEQARQSSDQGTSQDHDSLASLDRLALFPISARNALLAQEEDNAAKFEESGMSAVQTYLVDFLAQHKEATLLEAVRAKSTDRAHDASMQVQIERSSLTMPIEDLGERIDIFRSRIDDITLQRQTAKDILAGDERRAEQYVDERVERLRQQARQHLATILSESLADMDKGGIDQATLRKRVGDAIPPFFQKALTDLSDQVSRYVQQVLAAHQKRAEGLIESVRTTAADLFEIPYHAPAAGEVFTVDTRLYWHKDKWNTNFSPVPEGATDRLLPKRMRMRRLQRRWEERIESLVLVNAETVRWQLIQSLKKAFAHYRTELDEGLEQAISATLGAIETAKTTREGRQDQTQQRIAVLDLVLGALENLIAGPNLRDADRLD